MMKLVLVLSLEIASLFSMELVMDYLIERQLSDPK